ncbi:PREDICTED: uncharacterized protein LOC104608199 [Nelumbo nucifera]|uniref:Uncharacterized protein LOC104608199 n=1 Tax=Nelumbo nucifera TaxID=4432 RepID=A0A1U8B036_NELNU|nr:PREDICTED: uncharacterized protein LOC104608199 [Nelumbo nucifera]
MARTGSSAGDTPRRHYKAEEKLKKMQDILSKEQMERARIGSLISKAERRLQQAEADTAEANKRVDEAKKRAEEAAKRAAEAEQKAVDAEKRAQEAGKRADELANLASGFYLDGIEDTKKALAAVLPDFDTESLKVIPDSPEEATDSALPPPVGGKAYAKLFLFLLFFDYVHVFDLRGRETIL